MRTPLISRRRAWAAGALAFGLSIVAISAAALASNPGDPRRAVRVDNATALAAVRQFVPDPAGLEVVGLKDGATHRFYAIQSAKVDAAVDAYTGVVLTLAETDDMPTTATVAIGDSDAVNAAAAYAKSNGITIDGLTQSIELLDHGDSKEYVVTWMAWANGVRTPTLRSFSVNPETGKVYAFRNFDRPYVTPPVPRLAKAAAEAAARTAIGAPDAVVAKSGLAIFFDANGVQQLAYEIELTTTGGFYTNLQVDASSGTVTVVSRG